MKPKLSARQDLHSCEHTVNVKSGESQKGFKKKKSEADWLKTHRGKGKGRKECKEFPFTSEDSCSKIT